MRQRLNQLAMLRGRQGGIVHVSSVEPGGVGEGRRRRMAGGATVSVGTCVGTCVSLGIVTGWRSCVRCVVGCPARVDEAWAGFGSGSTGGIALQGGSTRRRHAAGRLRVVQNPPLGRQLSRRLTPVLTSSHPRRAASAARTCATSSSGWSRSCHPTRIMCQPSDSRWRWRSRSRASEA